MYKLIGPKSWKSSFEDFIQEYLECSQEKQVTVLRPILFFHAEQKTTLSKITTYFTPQAVNKLVHDEFITIHD